MYNDVVVETRVDLIGYLIPAQPEARLRRLLVVVVWLSTAFWGSTPSWNTNSRFDLVRAIVEDGTVTIDRYHENTGDKSFHDGHYFSDKAPGLSFLAVPIHFASYAVQSVELFESPKRTAAWVRGSLYLCTVLIIGLLSALAATRLYAVARSLGAAPTRALVVVLVYSLGTPALAYASLFFSHQLAAALLVFAFSAVLLDRELGSRSLLACGAALGLAVIVEYPAALGAATIVGYVAWTLPRPIRPRSVLRALAWIALGAVAPLVICGAYNTACFGAPWRIGYASLVPSQFSEGMSRGFFGVGLPSLTAAWGITFGGTRGLFVVSPILLPALVGLGWAALRASWRREARAFVIIVAGFFLLNSSYAFWNGGASFGPRHVVPMLPFLALGLLVVPWGRRWWRVGWIVLVTISVANAVAAVAVGADLPEYGHVLLRHVWPAVLAGDVPAEVGAYNLGTVMGLRGVVSVAPLLLFWLFTLPLLFDLGRRVR